MSLFDDKGHDLQIAQTYLATETVVCRKCGLRYVRDRETKIPVPFQIEDMLGHWPCDEFNNLAAVAEVMES